MFLLGLSLVFSLSQHAFCASHRRRRRHLPVPHDIGALRSLELASFQLLNRVSNSSGCTGVDFDIARLQSRKRLGSNVPGKQSLYPKFDNDLACLYARALGGI